MKTIALTDENFQRLCELSRRTDRPLDELANEELEGALKDVPLREKSTMVGKAPPSLEEVREDYRLGRTVSLEDAIRKLLPRDRWPKELQQS